MLVGHLAYTLTLDMPHMMKNDKFLAKVKVYFECVAKHLRRPTVTHDKRADCRKSHHLLCLLTTYRRDLYLKRAQGKTDHGRNKRKPAALVKPTCYKESLRRYLMVKVQCPQPKDLIVPYVCMLCTP